jgi:hypothetical protein
VQHITAHLQTSLSDDEFIINPEPNHPLWKYAAWPWQERRNTTGVATFNTFCDYLSQLSRMIVDMANKNYFEPKQRVEMAHLMCWMLGCTEYGQLSTTNWRIGYCDRITDTDYPLLEHSLQSKE